MYFCPVTTPFSQREVQEILGIAEATLHPLIERGILTSSIHPNGRTLSEPLLFNFFDIFRSKLFIHLGWPSVSIEHCEEIAEFVLDAFDAQFMSMDDDDHPNIFRLQEDLDRIEHSFCARLGTSSVSDHIALTSFKIYYELNRKLSSILGTPNGPLHPAQ
ncbi:hypothetical protein FALB51S_00440 [Frigidibacter albus]|uniref:Uncharacterized protein n=1 Tax=Frigidibacter mobilis TaxID=1335048 RepID=A0A159Z6Z1_9RHOB|nr:hypothetical protein AKL17_3933 [Frigidibacter mobilis]